MPCFSCLSENILNTIKRWVQPLLVSKGMVLHMKKRGKIIFMLGVNNDTTLALSKWTGCQAVLTDRVEWLSNAMKEGKEMEKKEKMK